MAGHSNWSTIKRKKGALDQKRGKILVGYKADILIFDPSKIKSNATFSNPHLLASGFDNIIINGKTEIGSGILLRK